MFSQAAFAYSLPPGCEMGGHPSVPITYTDDMRPVGTATINGAAVPVMLSTGAAESVVLNRKTLERLGIRTSSSTTKLPADDLERNPLGVDILRDVSHAMLEEFSFDQTTRKDVSYMVEDFMDDTFGVRMGAGSLLQSDLEIAMDAGYIKTFKPSGCFRAHLAYWDPQAVAVSAWRDPWKRDPRMVFTVRIGGKELRAVLSTATPHSYLPKVVGERLGLTPHSPGATREAPLPGHGPDQPVWKVPVASMTIGALEVKDLDLRLMDLPHSGEVLILGADFLHRHRVYIANSQKQVYFSPIATPRTMKRGTVNVIPQAIN